MKSTPDLRALEQELPRLQHRPAPIYPALGKILIEVVLLVLAWFDSRPLAGVVAILILGSMRGIVRSASPFWTEGRTLAVSAAHGFLTALVAFAASLYTVHSIPAQLGLGVAGFLGSGYIGYTPPEQGGSPSSEVLNHHVASNVELITYVVVLGACFGARALLQRGR